eukprot:355048-Chlamydomonas_euryale.AAC.8
MEQTTAALTLPAESMCAFMRSLNLTRRGAMSSSFRSLFRPFEHLATSLAASWCLRAAAGWASYD